MAKKLTEADIRATSAKAMDRLAKAQRGGQAAHDREVDQIASELRGKGLDKAAGVVQGLRGRRGK